VIAATLLATTCSAFGPEVEASVRGDNDTGRYIATVTNNTDADVYMTCHVDAMVEYGSVGSDQFLIRGVAGTSTDHGGRVSLDDGGAEYQIDCVKEFSVEPNATVGPINEAAAVRTCSAAYRFSVEPRPYDPVSKPEQRIRTGRHILRLAERSGDLGLVAAAERLLGDVNNKDGYVFNELFSDMDDACEGLGLDMGPRRSWG